MNNKIIFLFILAMVVSGCATTFDYTKGREDYIAAHPKTSEQTKSDIRGGFIKPGMTKEEVRASWGIPGEEYLYLYQKSRTCSSWGCTETWEVRNTYLTFVNDKLESFTNINY